MTVPTMKIPEGAVSWLEIDRAALAANVAAFRQRLSPGSGLVAVVKSNAYGHGVEIVAPIALEAGATALAVVTLDEGLALRRLVGPTARILVLGHIPAPALGEALAADLEATIYDGVAVESLAAAGRAQGRKARAHLKVETGTHRQGLPPREARAIVRLAAESEGVELVGLSTHFADIEDTTDHSFAAEQIDRFDAFARELGETELQRHSACSAATILFPETHLDLVRVGIGLYGLWPSRETLVSARERGLADFTLQPAMCWKSRIAQIKDVPRGGYVGYGRTWRATRDSRIAVLPVGYYDGYDRALSERAHVLVAGSRAPVVGRVCMNMMMVDLTDLPEATPASEVVLLGTAQEDAVRAEDLARWAGTIHYEVVSRIHPGLPRIPV